MIYQEKLNSQETGFLVVSQPENTAGARFPVSGHGYVLTITLQTRSNSQGSPLKPAQESRLKGLSPSHGTRKKSSPPLSPFRFSPLQSAPLSPSSPSKTGAADSELFFSENVPDPSEVSSKEGVISRFAVLTGGTPGSGLRVVRVPSFPSKEHSG